MRKDTFEFKEFNLRQDRCAMKFGTDAMLLGAFASPPISGFILDIGTGTGVLALMLAQKTEAIIHAVDVDEDAFIQATENFKESKWCERLIAFHTSFQEFNNRDILYNYIICNPPYFTEEVKEIISAKREKARQNKHLPIYDLLQNAARVLHPNGILNLIVNPTLYQKIRDMSGDFFFVTKEVSIKSFKAGEVIRYILFLSKEKQETSKMDFIIYEENQKYTKEYSALTSDYHMKVIGNQ
ncbi:MAG: methyltransferase [Bacteroidetes bacterium]|nr:methyltransferase [Bacteroidota bacterium]